MPATKVHECDRTDTPYTCSACGGPVYVWNMTAPEHADAAQAADCANARGDAEWSPIFDLGYVWA